MRNMTGMGHPIINMTGMGDPIRNMTGMGHPIIIYINLIITGCILYNRMYSSDSYSGTAYPLSFLSNLRREFLML
jgi:hypothetical protein